MGGVERGHERILAGEQLTRPEVREAQRLHVVVAREENAPVRMRLGQLGQAGRDGAERGLAPPARIDGVGVIPEETKRGPFTERQRGGAVDEADVLVNVGNNDNRAVGTKLEERAHAQTLA